MNPTNISNPKNGKGKINGNKKNITDNNTSPAKIFPNRRNEKDIIFEISPTNSRIPTKKFIGEDKFIYLDICIEIPSSFIPIYWAVKTEINAIAKVPFISVVAGLKNGINLPSSWIPIPSNGSNPAQFENKIKRKNVAINGKNFFAFPPVMFSVRSYNEPTITSANTCIELGKNVIEALITKANKTIKAETIIVVKTALLTGIVSKRWKTVSGAMDTWIPDINNSKINKSLAF